MPTETLIDQLMRHEGLRLKPYVCPAGKLSIGVGRNIEEVGITHEEALYLLNNDLQRCWMELRSAMPWVVELPTPAREVLTNMCFNMGISRLMGFKQFLAALERKDYATASIEMLDSKWARQVGARAVELAGIIRGLK